MYYLSIDCANKSLAIGLYNLSLDVWKLNLLQILTDSVDSNIDKLTKANTYLDSVVEFDFLKVIDLIPNKKVKETSLIERTLQLYKYISEIQIYIDNMKLNEIVNVYIEYQMNANDKSRAVYNQLIYAFADDTKYSVKVVVPTLKNKIYFCEELKHCRVLQNYSRLYTANKIHCKKNFLYFISLFNKSNSIKGIKKSNIDDVADTFMQMIGQIKYK